MMNRIGPELRARRKHKGLTQKQVADFLGLTVRAYQYYETGDRSPNLEKSLKLAEILEFSLDELSVRDCTTDEESVDSESTHEIAQHTA